MVLETGKKQCVQWWSASIPNVYQIVGFIIIQTNLQINAKHGMTDATIVFWGLKFRLFIRQSLVFSLIVQLTLLIMRHVQKDIALDKILQSAWNGKIALLMDLNRLKQIKSRIL